MGKKFCTRGVLLYALLRRAVVRKPEETPTTAAIAAGVRTALEKRAMARGVVDCSNILPSLAVARAGAALQVCSSARSVDLMDFVMNGDFEWPGRRF